MAANRQPSRIILASTGVLFGGLIGALYFNPSAAEESATPRASKEENPMPVIAARPRAIPPIDAAAPAKTETATFALG